MGAFEPLKENQPVEIELPGSELSIYRSRVEHVGDDRLVVASPMKGGAIIPVRPGTVVKVIYTDNVAVYTFSAEVLSQNLSNPSILLLNKPIDSKRIQRRNFVRLDTRLTVNLTRLDDKFIPSGETFSATTVDISGGGMMFEGNTLLQMGDVLEAVICLNEHETVRAIGRIVRIMENPPKSRNRYSVGFEFIIIEETERDKIIRFIFNRQRELRRKGLL